MQLLSNSSRHSHSAASIGAGLVAQRGGGGTRITPGQECPPGHHRNAARQLPGAVGTGAEHPRLPPAQHAGDRRAQGAEGEVPGRSTCTAIRGSSTPDSMKRARRDDGPAQPARADARRQHQRRSAGADDRGDQRLALQGSLPRARRHRLPQRRPGLGRQGDSAAARRHQGRRARRRRGRQAVRPAHHQAGRLAPEGRRSARSIRCGTSSRSSMCRRSSTPRNRRSSSSRRTCTTSAGSSCRCSRIAATTSRGR